MLPVGKIIQTLSTSSGNIAPSLHQNHKATAPYHAFKKRCSLPLHWATYVRIFLSDLSDIIYRVSRT